MAAPAFTCPKCIDGDGRPVKLEVGTVRVLAPGLARRWRRCPKCKAGLVTDERARPGAKPVALAAASHRTD